MNKRLAMLEKLTASPQADSFAFYCLAMEYRKEGRVDDAVAAFATLPNRLSACSHARRSTSSKESTS